MLPIPSLSPNSPLLGAFEQRVPICVCMCVCACCSKADNVRVARARPPFIRSTTTVCLFPLALFFSAHVYVCVHMHARVRNQESELPLTSVLHKTPTVAIRIKRPIHARALYFALVATRDLLMVMGAGAHVGYGRRDRISRVPGLGGCGDYLPPLPRG